MWCPSSAPAQQRDGPTYAPNYPHPLTLSLHSQDGKEPVRCSVPASTPAQQRGGPLSSSKAAKGGASGSASIDTAWVAEHAAQVTRMLPGGEWLCPSIFMSLAREEGRPE